MLATPLGTRAASLCKLYSSPPSSGGGALYAYDALGDDGCEPMQIVLKPPVLGGRRVVCLRRP
jgi:hypothetical protein